MVRISKKTEKAMKRARTEVRKSVLKKRKRKRDIPKASEPHVITRWVKDEWGKQGEVFFNGHYYWLIKGDCISSSLTPEKWEERKAKCISSGTVEVEKKKTTKNLKSKTRGKVMKKKGKFGRKDA